MYKERCFAAEKVAKKKIEELKKAEEYILVKVEAQNKAEVELKDLQRVYDQLLEKYNDNKNETNEFAISNRDHIERIINLEAQNKEEIKANSANIERIKAENKTALQMVEKETQDSKDDVKKMWREVLKERKEKENSKTPTKDAKAEIDKLKSELKTKDEDLKKLQSQLANKTINMDVEIDQWVDTGKALELTPKPQRAKSKNPRTL